jgi:MFS family permease
VIGALAMSPAGRCGVGFGEGEADACADADGATDADDTADGDSRAGVGEALLIGDGVTAAGVVLARPIRLLGEVDAPASADLEPRTATKIAAGRSSASTAARPIAMCRGVISRGGQPERPRPARSAPPRSLESIDISQVAAWASVPGRPVETRGAARCDTLPPVTTTSLWRHADFMKLWAGQTVSELGSVVTRTAVPLVALLVLGAGPFEMALLVVAGSLAVLLLGFFAGAWVDRLRRKPLLIGADAIRAVLLFSIPAAYLANVLRMEQLYVIVFLEGCLGAVFDAAYPAYVPTLIGMDRVVEGNSKLATSSSLAEIGGPGLAGGLVQLIGAPFAIFVDAISFVVSSISLLLIRAPEPPRPARTVKTPIGREIAEALALVRRHPLLLPITLRSVIAHVAGSFYGVLYTLFLLNELHLEPFVIGVVISAGGVGSLVGSLFAGRTIGRLGLGPALIWTAFGASVIGILTPLAGGPVALATLMVFLPQLVGDGLQTIEGVAELSLIQGVIPNDILGRVNATLEVFSHGIAYPVGALLAAVLADSLGVRFGIAVGWAGMAVSILLLVLSPLPRIRVASDARALEAGLP